MVVAVEDRFGICFDESDEAGIATGADLAAAVRRRLAAR
jgi:acyl carrier protein